MLWLIGFLTDYQSDIVVENESVNLKLHLSNHKAFIPYMWIIVGGVKFNHSFEALYRELSYCRFFSDTLRLHFLPLLVDFRKWAQGCPY
jgi:hypothetical protein